MVSTKESNQMFDGFEIAWTKFNRLEPMLFRLLASVETKESGRKIRYCFNMPVRNISGLAPSRHSNDLLGIDRNNLRVPFKCIVILL